MIGFKKNLLPLVLVLISFIWGCASVPVTERRQLQLIPENQILALSFDQYRQFLNEKQVVTGTPEAEMVQRVGGNIAEAVEAYLRNEGQADMLESFEWEFNLVADEAVNAFAMPGGKVVAFQGILNVAGDEAGLATVMGHEVAHVVARHGNERMSQGLIAQLGGVALDLALQQRTQQTRQLFMAAYGVGAQVGVLLPYGRLQESEADRLGLIFMAMAGYDPQEAIGFWERMSAQDRTGQSPPEFLSTHPSHGTRIEDLHKHMPEALAYYRQ